MSSVTDRLPPRPTLSHGAGRPAPSPDLVNLTIDGVDVSVPKGTLVIRAAETVGIEIPRFCDHPLLEPVGACRQCLVDIALPDKEAVRPDAEAPGVVHDHGVPGHGRQHAAHLPGGRQGAAGRDGVPPHQPPARLPGLRQGRRVPAAEPGHEQRPGRVPLRGRQAHLPQADQHQLAGPARPGAVRALRPLHPVLRPDRR